MMLMVMMPQTPSLCEKNPYNGLLPPHPHLPIHI